MTTDLIVLLCLTVAAILVFLILRPLKGGLPAIISKTIASLLFTVFGLLCALHGPYPVVVKVLLPLGLLCGTAGDAFMDLSLYAKKNNDMFLDLGFLSFGLGHLFYFVSFFVITAFYNDSNLWIGAVVAIGLGLIISVGNKFGSKFMRVNYGEHDLQSNSYLFFLAADTVFAFATLFYTKELFIVPIGLGLFFISDIILSFILFKIKKDAKVLYTIVHVLYYVAQLLIAFSALALI